MRKGLHILLLVLLCGSLAAQTKKTRAGNGSKMVFEGQPASVQLAPGITTTIRIPEPVNSVVVGDSNLFQAEYSAAEPLLVFAKATASGIAQTNLVISTVSGRQFILVLRSVGALGNETESGVDLLVVCQASRLHFIEETFPTALISETVGLGRAVAPPNTSAESGVVLDETLNRQRQEKPQALFGDRIRVAIGPVIENGSRLIVPFSVLNSKADSIELVSPQVQLAGQSKTGILRRSRWTTVQQIPVQAFQMTQRKLKPGARADGVVTFERPAIKQSTEGLFLQIADSGAIDRPTLAPINFRQAKARENNHE